MTTTMTTGTEGQLNWGDAILKSGLGAALLALLVSIVKAGEKILPGIIARKMKVDVLAGITDISPAYKEMELAIAKDGAQRVLMFAAHNSGHIPSPFTPFFTSVIHAAADTFEHRQRASSYQNIRVDAAYIEMLLEMERLGHFRFTPGEHPGTMLDQFYSAEGIKDSIICYLGVFNNSLVYVSFANFARRFTDNEVTWHKLRAKVIQKIMEDSR